MNLNEILLNLLMLVVTAVITAVSQTIKQKFLVDKSATELSTARKIVDIVVRAVEQVYIELDGSERYEKSVKKAQALLSQNGISLTEEQLKLFIESSVQTMNAELDKNLAK